MNCDIVRDLLPLYADGLCSVESRRAVEVHLKTCEACRKLLPEGPAEAGQEPAAAEGSAAEVAQAVGITEYRAGLLPGGKSEYIGELIGERGKGQALAFVGDGINDAP